MDSIDDLKDGDKVDMTDEEIEEFNRAEAEKQAELKARQAANRAKPVKKQPRDKAVVRGVKGTKPIKVVCLRRVGLDNDETSEIGETITLPKEAAIRLQDAGAIKVKL